VEIIIPMTVTFCQSNYYFQKVSPRLRRKASIDIETKHRDVTKKVEGKPCKVESRYKKHVLFVFVFVFYGL